MTKAADTDRDTSVRAPRDATTGPLLPDGTASTLEPIGGPHAEQTLAVDLADLERLVDRFSALDLDELDGSTAVTLLVRLRHLAGRLTVTADQALPVIEADGLWALDGSASLAAWAARATGTPLVRMRRDLRTARALRDLTRTVDAARAGSITPDHARTLATAAVSSPARAETLAAADGPNESALLAHARTLHPDPFATLVAHWAAHADPDAADRAYRDAAEREHVHLARTLGGFHLRGFLTDEHGQALSTALDALIGVPAATDTRTPAQRRARAMHDLARHALDNPRGGAGASVRPHLSVLVPLTHLRGTPDPLPTLQAQEDRGEREDRTVQEDRGVHEDCDDQEHCGDHEPLQMPSYEDGTPVPRDVLDRLACDSELTRIVLDAPGVVLDVGRTRRTVTRELRRAVIARDRHCAFPDCTTPPTRCEVHHPHHWSRGGVTSVTNSVLLCWHHHEWVHRHHISIARTTTGAGLLWVFTDRHGDRIAPATPVGARPG